MPGITGYRGDGLASTTAVDPQTVTADGAATMVAERETLKSAGRVAIKMTRITTTTASPIRVFSNMVLFGG